MLIGAERERRKGSGPSRSAAGIRTFAIVSLLGAVSELLGSSMVLAITTLIVGIFAVLSYQESNRSEDPGMTTEIALILTCLLGGLAIREALLASAIGTALAVLLAAKNRLHYFVSKALTERELHDALLFCSAALIILPLAPDRYMGPFEAINPHHITGLIVLVMGVSALGYIAMRSLGQRYGLPLAGLAGGFISSIATIYSLGNRAAEHPLQMHSAVAGAVLSSVATIIQMVFVVTLIEPALLKALFFPLLGGGLAAVAYSLFFIRRRLPTDHRADEDIGHAFDPKSAIVFAVMVSFILLLSAGVNAWLGPRGVVLTAALTGFVDTHATAASIASLAHVGKISMEAASWPVLLGFTTNSIMKIVIAFKAGGGQFALYIVPGIVLILLGLWLGAWFAYG